MSSLAILQITSLMCFIYAIKVKMYKANLVGFLVNCMFFLLVVIEYLNISDDENIHYLLASVLLIFISAYHTYKAYRRSHRCS
jgi:hypothetical protein